MRQHRGSSVGATRLRPHSCQYSQRGRLRAGQQIVVALVALNLSTASLLAVAPAPNRLLGKAATALLTPPRGSSSSSSTSSNKRLGSTCDVAAGQDSGAKGIQKTSSSAVPVSVKIRGGGASGNKEEDVEGESLDEVWGGAGEGGGGGHGRSFR